MKKLPLVCFVAAICLPSFALAHSAGDVLIRAGVATVMPDESSDDVLGLGEFNVKNNTQLGLTGAYMITDNIGVELLAATPFSHKVGLNGVGNIAKVKHLPPTLVAQYYFLNSESAWRPYIGAGINYTTFFDEKFTNDLGGDLTDIKAKDSWGFAGQIGMDYMVTNNLMVNASAWWIDIDTDVKFKYQGDQQKIKTNIDPWVFMLGVGYRF